MSAVGDVGAVGRLDVEASAIDEFHGNLLGWLDVPYMYNMFRLSKTKQNVQHTVHRAGLEGKKCRPAGQPYREVLFSRNPSEAQCFGRFVVRAEGFEPPTLSFEG